MSRILLGDENTLLHTHPYNFNSPPEKTDLGKENPDSHSLRHGLRNGALSGTRTDITPENETDRHYLTHTRALKKDQEHYVAIMKRGNEWTSCNDAFTAQTTLTQLHQTQAYIMIYRKMEHSEVKMEHREVTEIDASRDSTMANQQLPAKKSNPSHNTQHRNKEFPLHQDPLLTNEMTCIWLGVESQRKEIPLDPQTQKLIDGLSEDSGRSSGRFHSHNRAT